MVFSVCVLERNVSTDSDEKASKTARLQNAVSAGLSHAFRQGEAWIHVRAEQLFERFGMYQAISLPVQ